MSGRLQSSKRSHPGADRPALSVVSSWLIRIYLLILILGVPWYYGCATWNAQYVLFSASLGLPILIGFHCLSNLKSHDGTLSIPWLTWVFWGLSLFALIQTVPRFAWDGTETIPASVSMQRWALGLTHAPRELDSQLLLKSTEANAQDESMPVPCDLTDIPLNERTLAWSIEPLHTKGAIASLVLCGLLVWAGRMVFSTPTHQLWLFGALTFTGTAIACIGIHGATAYNAENFLALKSGGSFATFVSKNSAGGFYNICIAGSLGLIGWTLLNTRRKRGDIRYRFPDSNWITKIRGTLEDLLADLNTPQIASMLGLVIIVAALTISLCRGAAMSAIASIVIASIVANAKSQNNTSWIIAVTVMVTALAALIGFQLDDQAYGRLESISEIDFSQELRAGRLYIWLVAWKAMQFYGWLGSGLGTFHFAYLPFQDPSTPGWYYHAESLYAQCAVELGYCGILVLIGSLVLIVLGLLRRIDHEHWRIAFPAKLAGVYLVFSQLLHSFVDFAIILPSLFVPACILIGSVQGLLSAAAKPPKARRKKTSSTSGPSGVTKPTPESKPRFGIITCLLGIAMATLSGVAMFGTLESLRSLERSEALGAWVKAEDRTPISEQQTDRIRELAKLWSEQRGPVSENSTASLYFADGFVFDYRVNQLLALPTSLSWDQAWVNTSPLLLQVALDSEKNMNNRERIIEMVGGPDAIVRLQKAASWYAKGQMKSPLDWRLLDGRCLANIHCNRSDMKALLYTSGQLSQHEGQQLIEIGLLFKEQLTLEQREAMLAKALRSSPDRYITVGRLLASEYEDGNVPIRVFPQHFEMYGNLANQVFTEDKFPATHRMLWEQSRDLAEKSKMNTVRRSQWLADAAAKLGNRDDEISHLRVLVRFDPNNMTLLARLAGRLLDNGETAAAKAIYQQAQRIDPLDNNLKVLANRFSNSLP